MHHYTTEYCIKIVNNIALKGVKNCTKYTVCLICLVSYDHSNLDEQLGVYGNKRQVELRAGLTRTHMETEEVLTDLFHALSRQDHCT